MIVCTGRIFVSGLKSVLRQSLSYLFLFLLCTVLSVGCLSPSDDAQLNVIDNMPENQQPSLSALEREGYEKQGFEFDEGLFDEREVESGGRGALTPGHAELDLPAELERVDIDRFLRDRRTLTALFDPLDAKYRSHLALFEPDMRLSPDVIRELKLKIWDALAQHHWVFIEGLYQFQTDLAEASRAGLRQKKKRIIVHHVKALTFLGQALDERMGDSRYLSIVRNLYRMMADRHLMRPLRDRQK